MKGDSNLPKYILDWRGVLALISGAVLSSMLLVLSGIISIKFFNFNFENSNVFLVFGNIFTFMGCIFSFDYFICRPTTGKRLNFNFSGTDAITYLLIFPMMFGMMLISEFATSLVPTEGPFWGKYYHYFSELMNALTNNIVILVLLSVIFAPIFEEIIFRGIIQKGLINKGLKPKNAVLISAIVFGIVHQNPWQFVGAVLLGYVLGIVYWKTKSLLLSILLHSFNNLLSSLLIIYGNTENFALFFKFNEWEILIFGIVIFSFFYYLFMKKYNTEK